MSFQTCFNLSNFNFFWLWGRGCWIMTNETVRTFVMSFMSQNWGTRFFRHTQARVTWTNSALHTFWDWQMVGREICKIAFNLQKKWYNSLNYFRCQILLIRQQCFIAQACFHGLFIKKITIKNKKNHHHGDQGDLALWLNLIWLPVPHGLFAEPDIMLH